MQDNLNNNQLLRIDIEMLDRYQFKKYPQLNVQNLVTSNISQYLNQLSVIENQIPMIQAFLQKKYQNIPLSSIIQTLTNAYQQKQKQLKKSHIYEILLSQQNQKSIEKVIEITQNMIINEKFWIEEDQQQQQQKQEKPNKQDKIIIQEENTANFIQNQCHQNQNNKLEVFEGQIVLNAISKAKQDKQYLNQKKVVHVYTKKGYGIQKYSQYLQKRKLDQKQWSFYINNLKNNNNYQKYMNEATRITLITIIECLKKSKYNQNINIFQNKIKSQQFENLVDKIYSPPANQGNQFKSCMRIIYDLKTDDKPSIKQLKEFIDKILQKKSKQIINQFI